MPYEMKFLSTSSSTRHDERSSDRTYLIATRTDQGRRSTNDDDDDDNDEDDDLETEIDDGRDADGTAECGTRHTYGATRDRRGQHLDAHTTSADVIEVCVEEEQSPQGKKKKKSLRKRVRKRMWRVMRSSWKYFRRGMAGSSPGIAAMFNWGVNFNQASSVAASRSNRKGM